MKKLAVLLFVFAMSATTTFANTGDGKRKEDIKKERKEVRALISKLLKDYDPISSKEVKAEVTFMINNKKEIVVLSVETKDRNIEGYIKGKLNYQSIKTTSSERMKVYRLPLRFVKV
jgi:cytochrome c556